MLRFVISFFSIFSFSILSGQSDYPNVIFILADDLGYGELGVYGQQKIETPHLDQMAKQGLLFTQHYAGSAVCAPSRCVLLTGKHSGHASIRGNDEWGSRGDVWNFDSMYQDERLEGQRPMPSEEFTLGELFRSKGYRTGMVGKWGLGAPHSESTPNKQGFDFFYGYNCQRQAHTYYPTHLYKNEERVYLKNELIPPRNQVIDSLKDPGDEKLYGRFSGKEYAPDLMFNEIEAFVNENQNQPFFLMWTTTIPHLALQAPDKWVDYYADKFGDEIPYTGQRGYFPCFRPWATYAAMITYLDDQIGKLMKQLDSLDMEENTIIIFTSDNGPSYTGGTDSEWFNSGGIFDSNYGKGKGYLHEGGIRVPLIIQWKDHIEPGRSIEHISAFQDFFPTFCDLLDEEKPDSLDGISFLPALLGENQREHEYLYWEIPEYGGQRAVRWGDWKAIQKDIKNGNREIELYNLEEDIKELKNQAQKFPDKVKFAKKLFIESYRDPENKRFELPIND